MRLNFKMFVLMLCAGFLFSACGGGRVPTAKTAQSVTRSFFKNYSKKYKTSVLGQNPIEKVEINGVREQSYHHAEIEAFLGLKDGHVARVLLTVRSKPPLGWNVLSWEMIDLR